MSARSVPVDCRRYYPAASNPPLRKVLQDARADLPIRAKSVCLAERPRSKYVRNVRSADTRSRFPEHKQFFFQQRPPSKPIPRPRTNKVIVKQQNRKVLEKVPCAVSVQTLSIPMKYADTNTKHSTSKRANIDRADYKTKTSNPPKQVSDYQRLCSTVGCGKETENKLLLQIYEAEQVSDFERILNSNAILCERSHVHVWRRCDRLASTASVLPRPKSAFSLDTVSQAYHQLFRQHDDTLQPLIQQYRQAVAAELQPCPHSVLQQDWFENLQDLSEFYEDDQSLQEEIETITDKIVLEEVKASTSNLSSGKGNFKVNLTDLIGLHVNGEGCSPISTQDGPSPDVEKGCEHEAEDKEWLGASMSENSEFKTVSQNHGDSVDCIAKNLESCKISSNDKIPTITFSNCCESRARSELPDNNEVVIHLTVPSIESADESRPPM